MQKRDDYYAPPSPAEDLCNVGNALPGEHGDENGDTDREAKEGAPRPQKSAKREHRDLVSREGILGVDLRAHYLLP